MGRLSLIPMAALAGILLFALGCYIWWIARAITKFLVAFYNGDL